MKVKRTKTVFAWLIENTNGHYIMWENGNPAWTSNPYKALWFCRKEDAESISQEDEDAWFIVEHQFEV